MVYRLMENHYLQPIGTHMGGKPLKRPDADAVREFRALLHMLAKSQLKVLKQYVLTLRERAKADLKLLNLQQRHSGKGPNFLDLLAFDPAMTARNASTYMAIMKTFYEAINEELNKRGRKGISKRAKSRKGQEKYAFATIDETT